MLLYGHRKSKTDISRRGAEESKSRRSGQLSQSRKGAKDGQRQKAKGLYSRRDAEAQRLDLAMAPDARFALIQATKPVVCDLLRVSAPPREQAFDLLFLRGFAPSRELSSPLLFTAWPTRA